MLFYCIPAFYRCKICITVLANKRCSIEYQSALASNVYIRYPWQQYLTALISKTLSYNYWNEATIPFPVDFIFKQFASLNFGSLGGIYKFVTAFIIFQEPTESIMMWPGYRTVWIRCAFFTCHDSTALSDHCDLCKCNTCLNKMWIIRS